jgi:hypothetical protein
MGFKMLTGDEFSEYGMCPGVHAGDDRICIDLHAGRKDGKKNIQ